MSSYNRSGTEVVYAYALMLDLEVFHADAAGNVCVRVEAVVQDFLLIFVLQFPNEARNVRPRPRLSCLVHAKKLKEITRPGIEPGNKQIPPWNRMLLSNKGVTKVRNDFLAEISDTNMQNGFIEKMLVPHPQNLH